MVNYYPPPDAPPIAHQLLMFHTTRDPRDTAGMLWPAYYRFAREQGGGPIDALRARYEASRPGPV